MLEFVQKGLILQCLIMMGPSSYYAITTASDTSGHDDMNVNAFTARSLGRSLAQCFGARSTLECFEEQLLNVIETAIADNSTWHFSDYLWIEKEIPTRDAAMPVGRQKGRGEQALSDRIGVKLLELARTRTLRLGLPTNLSAAIELGSQRGISDALDALDFGITTGLANGGASIYAAADEGRKKKDKDKNMAMMGGMAMMAMVAQMFLGKVILIAGAAFVMAKIALLISVLGSLKKGSTGSSGSTEHIIVTGGGGGGGGGGGHSSHAHEVESSSGWHRSMPHELSKFEVLSDHHHSNDQQDYLHQPIVADSSSVGAASGPPMHSHYQITETEGDGDGNGYEYRRRRKAAALSPGFL